MTLWKMRSYAGMTKEEEDKKKNGYRKQGQRQAAFTEQGFFYDRDYCALFIVIFLMDMVVPLFELYCALDGFGFNN